MKRTTLTTLHLALMMAASTIAFNAQAQDTSDTEPTAKSQKTQTQSSSTKPRVQQQVSTDHSNDIYTNTVQNVQRTMNVEDYQALGIRVPLNFILYPTINLEEKYDSNVFRTDGNEDADFITAIRPGIALTSDWDNHLLRFTADGDFGYYADNSSEDYEDFALEGDGRFDVLRSTFITGGLRYAQLHEFRGSPSSLGGTEPPEFEQTTAKVGFAHQPGRLKFSVDAKNDNWQYDESVNTGLPSGLLSERDRDEQRYQARVAYELYPGYDAFVQYAFENREFDKRTTLNRDSDANEYSAGIAVALTGTLRGEVYGGYFQQEYDGGGKDVDFINYGGALTWNLSSLTSLKGEVYRDVRPTIIGNASDFIETSYSAEVSHALLRNLVLNGRLRYVQDEFTGPLGDTGRDDDLYFAGIGADYYFDRNIGLRTRYDYIQRDSTQTGQDFKDNVIFINAFYAY